MAHAIRFDKPGGPDVLTWQAVEVGKPGEGQVRLRHRAVGLNYIDTYHRSGLYQLPMPSGLGSEGAGVVEEVGSGVSGLNPGDRVAYAGGPIGAYADERVMPAERLVPIPDGITDQQAAAMMLKGMTAWYLVRRTHPVKRGETILIHAASGAVGPVDIGILAAKGSLFLTRPTLNTYTASREDLLTAARELFEVVNSGAVKIAVNQTYPLREAARAHRDLQDRKTTGS